jgi:hypothetical protein
MLLLILSMALADPAPPAFPERTPALIEACLTEAVKDGIVSDTEGSHKYICMDEAAERFWAYLEAAGIEAVEQDTAAEGRWLTRDFPLGACFKRIRMADGSPATTGLSCTIWIPRPVP